MAAARYLNNVAMVDLEMGNTRSAQVALQEAHDIETRGTTFVSGTLTFNLGLVDLCEGDGAHATQHFIDSLNFARHSGEPSFSRTPCSVWPSSMNDVVRDIVPRRYTELRIAFFSSFTRSGRRTRLVCVRRVASAHAK